MFYRHSIVPRAMAIVAMVGLSAGCSAIIHNGTVLTTDTYDLWSDRVDHIPYVFHFADGHVEAYDDQGNAWTDAERRLQAYPGARVEVYVDGARTPSAALCDKPATVALAATTTGKPNVVSVLCDNTRTVVSFTDHVKPGALAARKAYISRVRRLLLDGIWACDPDQPEPLPS